VIRPVLGLLIATSSWAQPRFAPGGEASLGIRVLWEGQSTGDGFDAHGVPALAGQMGVAVLGPAVASWAVDWSTFGVSQTEGPVSVKGRHHQFGLGPHIFWMDPSLRAGLVIETLVDVVSTRVALDGAGSENAVGVNVGLRYGFESVARFAPLPVTAILQLGGQRRDGRDDIYLGFSLGWIWGAMNPSTPHD
jgi:hypothetical protein